jgi:excisionase family DNA binding protein
MTGDAQLILLILEQRPETHDEVFSWLVDRGCKQPGVRYMRTDEAAELWDVHEETVRKWYRQERIPGADKPGARILIPIGAKPLSSKEVSAPDVISSLGGKTQSPKPTPKTRDIKRAGKPSAAEALRSEVRRRTQQHTDGRTR